jgi:hypothetical protein
MCRKVEDDCLLELRWMYDRHDLAEVRRDLAAWLVQMERKIPKLTGWVEENIGETLTYFRPPLAHRKHTKSTNMLERLNEEIRRRTYVVRIFSSTESCLRLVRALTVERHEAWLEEPSLSQHGSLEGAQESYARPPERGSGRPRGWANPLSRRRSLQKQDRFKNLRRPDRKSPCCRGRTPWQRRRISSHDWNQTLSENPTHRNQRLVEFASAHPRL